MVADQGDRRSGKVGAGKTLLGDVLQATREAAAGGQQLALLPGDEAVAELPGPRGPGRPPGARNKATEELRAWARSRFGDPGLRLMDLAFRDPKELSRDLNAESAWAVQVKQAEWLMRLLPFFWAAMPAELQVKATRHLAVSISATPGGPAGDRETALDPLQALLDLQRLSASDDAQLHVTELHVEPNPDDETEG